MKNKILLGILLLPCLLIIPIEVDGNGWEMDTDLSFADASFIGENIGDGSGKVVSMAGDVNGDGYDDFLINAPYNDEGGSDAGQTYLIFGKSSGWSMDTDLSNANASFIAENSGDYSEYSAGVGDVNGDGYDDFLISSRWNDESGPNSGQTYLFLGKSSGWSMDTDLSSADASFLGAYDYQDSGDVLSHNQGDVNGDGYDDILIGACYHDPNYLIFGKATGWSMDTDLSTADVWIWGENSNDCTGVSIDIAGDVNGDGFDDILIGANHNGEGGSNAGQTYLIFGKSSGWSSNISLSSADASFIGEGSYDWSGRFAIGGGDVNGDGFDDILIGAFLNDENGNDAGQTYLILGKDSGWSMDTDLSTVDASFFGEDSGDHSGYCFGGSGDFNGDGFSDILIGSRYNDDGGSNAGQSYLFYGKDSGWSMDTDLSTADVSFIGEYSGDWSGRHMAMNGDVNGDGFDDIIIGAYGNDEGGGGAGQTYLLLGARTIIDPYEAIEDLNDYIQGLSASSFKNNANNRKNAFDNKIDGILKMLEDDNLTGVIAKLEDDIRSKADGDIDGDKNNDWIIDSDAQENICMMIDDIIDYLKSQL